MEGILKIQNFVIYGSKFSTCNHPETNMAGSIFSENMFYNIIFEHFPQLCCYNYKLPGGRIDKRITKI